MLPDLQPLANLELVTHTGEPVRFGSAWESGPALLVFLRHYGWLLCREHAAEFRPHEEALKKDGITLVFVGMGLPAMADDFRTQMKLSTPVWVDTKRLTYKALAFTRGADKVFNLRSMLNALRALSKGHRQHRTQGDPLLNGGVLVARKGGACTYAWASQVSGDHPKTADVLDAARRA